MYIYFRTRTAKKIYIAPVRVDERFLRHHAAKDWPCRGVRVHVPRGVDIDVELVEEPAKRGDRLLNDVPDRRARRILLPTVLTPLEVGRVRPRRLVPAPLALRNLGRVPRCARVPRVRVVEHGAVPTRSHTCERVTQILLGDQTTKYI